jgi:glucokinase
MIISEAAAKGDELAREVWREFGSFLGVAVGSLINIFSPDIFAIGGQISKAHEWFLPTVITEAGNVAAPTLFADTLIVLAEQIEDAGILGGAALALESAR